MTSQTLFSSSPHSCAVGFQLSPHLVSVAKSAIQETMKYILPAERVENKRRSYLIAGEIYDRVAKVVEAKISIQTDLITAGNLVARTVMTEAGKILLKHLKGRICDDMAIEMSQSMAKKVALVLDEEIVQGRHVDPYTLKSRSRLLKPKEMERFRKIVARSENCRHMCCLCLENYERGQDCLAMPCLMGHIVHEYCALKWFKGELTCPTCLQTIV